ncbi:MAG: tetraacyldisaccharide 4'-kinase [Gammaproteobacteria bacterium]
MRLYNFFTKTIWYNKRVSIGYYLFFCLFELIYKYIIFFRKKLYEYKIFKTHKFKLPIIIVGNITVGGTGKTPLVIYIANYLQNQGFKPAIISRGYRSKSTSISLVSTGSDPIMFGDEPVLLAKATNCPVVIGKNRVSTIEFLLKKFNNINVIICDDGLQHYKLARDLEIAVIDSLNQFGNGHLLPLGPLREPIYRLNTVDLVIINGNQPLSYQYQNQYTINLLPDQIYNLLDPDNIKIPADFTEVHAVSGIGNNKKFFDLLKNQGIKIITHEFPDHYNYQEKDLNFNDNLPVIMTEKDAVKCLKFAKSNFWCQTIIVNINLLEELNSYLINFLRKYNYAAE